MAEEAPTSEAVHRAIIGADFGDTRRTRERV